MIKISKKLIYIAIFVVFTAAVALSSACAESTTETWVRKHIENDYYIYSGDYSSVSDLKGLSIEEMVSRLDIYSGYMTPSQFAAKLTSNGGSKSGIGVNSRWQNGGVLITSINGNSPAKRAGLTAGDIIVGATLGGEYIPFNTHDEFMDFVAARSAGEQFTLHLSDGGTATLAKEDYTASYAAMYSADTTYEIEYAAGSSSAVLKKSEGGFDFLPEGTAYMTLSQFYGNAAAETGLLLNEFSDGGYDSLIIDLRGNGGGYVNVMASIAGRFTSFLGEDCIAMKARYKDDSEIITLCDRYSTGILPQGTSVYIMADSDTASASETLIGVLISYGITDYDHIYLSDYGDGNVRSYGKGIMQSTFVNIKQEALKLTVAGVFWQNGRCIQGTGITPADGCHSLSAEGVARAGDEEVRQLSALLSA